MCGVAELENRGVDDGVDATPSQSSAEDAPSTGRHEPRSARSGSEILSLWSGRAEYSLQASFKVVECVFLPKIEPMDVFDFLGQGGIVQFYRYNRTG